MSENLRMFGIVAVFLGVGSLMWFLLSDSGVEEVVEGPVAAPVIGSREGEIPEFEFDAVARPRSSAPVSVEKPAAKAVGVVEEEGDEESLIEDRKVIRKAGPGKISGEVTLTVSGELPADLLVVLHSIPDVARYDGSIDTVIDSTAVSAEGKYSFEKLALGSYTLFANSEQYTGTVGTALTKERPERTRNLELYGAAFISGVVVDRDGNGISEAHVYVAGYLSGGNDLKAGMERSRGSGVGVSEDGEFIIRNLQVRVPILQYRLLAMAPGYAATVTDLIATDVSGVSIVLGAGGEVSGIVINTGTQEAVADVAVLVEAEYALATKEGRTDENGEFALIGLRAGEHSIGIVDDLLVVTNETATVTVYDGQSIDDLVLEVQTGAVIAGRVYDSDSNAGIVDIQITGIPQEIANAARKTAMTDSEGYYSLQGLHAGSYRVAYGEVTGYNSQGRWEDEKNVVTRSASTSPGIDFALSGGLRISGIVVDAQGGPVAEANVSGYRERGGGQSDYQQTKADGRFTLSGYKPNTRIKITPTATDLAGDAMFVDLETESVTGLRIEMVEGAKISGTIVGKNGRPNGGVGVYASSLDNPYGNTDTAGGDGKFTLTGLMAGEYGLKPYRGGSMNSRDKSLATVTVRAGEHKENVRVVWDIEQGMFSISGLVTDDRGEPVSGVRLYSWGGTGGQINASTNAKGEFKFAGVSDGSYQIQGQRQGYQNSSVSAAAGAVDANMTMARAGSISGRVVEARSNAAVQDFSILVVNSGQRYQSYMERDRKSFHHEEGEFTIDGAYPGTVQLMFKSPGRADITLPVDGVRSAETLEGIVVSMETGLELTGRVRNTVGDALGGAYIYIGPVPPNEWERERSANTTADASGNFTLTSLPSGDVVVSAWAAGYLGDSMTARLGGGSNSLDFVLGTGGTVEGYVYVGGEGQGSVNLYGNFTGSGGRISVNGSTDSNGFYQIEGLAAGTIRLNANYNDGTQQRNMSTTVEVALGMVTEYDFEFVSTSSSVEGYLMAGAGQPTAGSANLQVDTGAGTESRYVQVGSDGHYLFENVPAGTVTLRGYSANRQASKRVTGELGENDVMRLDVDLYGGVSILFSIDGTSGFLNVVVIAMPAGYSVPATLTEETFLAMNQSAVQTGYSQGESGSAEIEMKYMEAGEYVIVAMGYVMNAAGNGLDYELTRLVSTELRVAGDADMQVSLSF